MKKRQSSIGRIVASRKLEIEGIPGQQVTISIGMPRPDSRGRWRCPLLVEGMGEAKVQTAGGADSLQSLLQAIERIRLELEETGRRFFWLDTEFGSEIPRFVPVYGRRFDRRVNAFIDREIARVWEARLKARKLDIAECEADLNDRKRTLAALEESVKRRKANAAAWEASMKKAKRSLPKS
jgi:hypothetical protein